jgi:hypothetical protein
MLSYLREVSVNNRSQHLVLLDAQLQPLAEQSWPVFIGQQVAVAGGPTGFAVGHNGMSRVRRLDASGGWLDNAWIASPYGVDGIARDGAGYLIANSTEVRRLDDASDVLGPPAALPDDAAFQIEIASDGDARILAWAWSNGDGTGMTEVRSARLDATGASLDPTARVVPQGTPVQLWPALGTVSGQTFIAFTEMSREGSSIRYGLFDATAANPASGMHEIPSAWAPDLASGADSTLLVWSSSSQILAANVSSDGTLGVPHVLVDVVEGTVGSPRVTATPTGFVVTYRKAQGDSLSLVHALTLSSDGAVLSDVSVALAGYGVPVAVGDDTVVALKQEYASNLAVHCLSNAKELTLGASAPGEAPDIASNGSLAFVVWTDDASRRIHGAMVDSACSSATAFPITQAGNEAISPSVVFDGERYLVVWRELGSFGADLRATRIATDGTVLDPSGFVISADPEKELKATVGRAAGSILVAYPRFDPAANAIRLWMRSLE